ncbi:hypothetical protein [Fangia hongkongensis]|uniref:hypothetical protein n=1 Tax=Fangia hongkongensis TaxID=270495 RepID=UPI00035C9B55|nr:hypothetical protein [Fangia hongkongensis]MBK2123774.1 hypothetical protein [Fangia hongkongensis]
MIKVKRLGSYRGYLLLRKVLYPLWWVLESQWVVVSEHRKILKICRKSGSPSAFLVILWAPIMCFPQWFIAPLFGFKLLTLAIFFARILAMCIVRKLDEIMPFTRGLGLCHLLSFGPVLVLLWVVPWPQGESVYFYIFLWSQIAVISLCIFFDVRDFLFYLAGESYPCYIREAVRNGALQVENAKAYEAVTWKSRLLGP